MLETWNLSLAVHRPHWLQPAIPSAPIVVLDLLVTVLLPGEGSRWVKVGQVTPAKLDPSHDIRWSSVQG